MEDRFKFRVVINGEIKNVYYFYELGEKPNIVFVCTNQEESKGYFIPKDQLIQCTGLKDKNGKLIYEGDIVKIKYSNLVGDIKKKSNGLYYINHKEVNLKYEYQIHCEICETSNKPFFIDFYDPYELEIIGNIYENPELLEQ